MAVNWTSGETVGNNDPAVSPYLKTWIYQNGTIVCGVTGEGTSKEIQANWNSPFEGESVGAKFEKTAGLVQLGTGRTSHTTTMSAQIWAGNNPTNFSITLLFYALSDPLSEVMTPLKTLEQFIAPEVNDLLPGGRVPGEVILNIGRRLIYPACVIESVSSPIGEQVDSAGRSIRAEVQLQIQTKQMINRSQVAGFYG